MESSVRDLFEINKIYYYRSTFFSPKFSVFII